MAGSLAVSEVSSDSEFLALRRQWNGLVEADEQATIFQTWEFQYHTWRIFADAVSLCIVLVRDDTGNLVGCAPLGTSVWRLGPLSARILKFASGGYCDYCDFLVHRDRAEDILVALSAWFRENLHRWDVVSLRSLRDDSWVRRENIFLSKTTYPSYTKRSSTAPYLRFQPAWSSYEDALNKKRARSTRYKVRKLFRKFDGRFGGIVNGESIEKAMEKLMDLHQERMREKHYHGIFANAHARREMGALIRELGARGLAKVHTIASDKRTIAAICTFEFRGTVSYYQSGFDMTYAWLSPGLVIHCLRITEGLKDSAHTYDFLEGHEPYKLVWANGECSLYQIELLTGSWRRVPYHWWDQARLWFSQWKWARVLYLRYFSGTE
jgi:CelD/BcsL family acetyltransferase involved in cellulose biosynthesis